MTNDEKIKLIGQKILILSNNLEKYKQELEILKAQLNNLTTAQSHTTSETKVSERKPVEEIKIPVVEIQQPIIPPVADEVKMSTSFQAQAKPAKKTIKPSLSFEERVGARWFSIIGIITLVIGIAIGVKYAIDKDLINEVTRLTLGYVAGSVILVLALLYKKKYEIFSAILLSGAMAVMYFTTYAGYSYYHFYNAPVAFLIMALFTGFTVYSAYVYNYEVIALLALVGGYSLPLLLSTGSGEIQYMFGFMLILNSGILILSFVKYWKFVNHVAYALTWMIFAVWMASSYSVEVYLGRTLSFATAFYILFYLSFISYKIFRNKSFSAWDVILILSNSLIYFGIGYNALDHLYYDRYLGLFCILNALIHLGFALLCRYKEVSDKTIYHFIIAMVISFTTMAIPVQLEGNFVTLIWITEMIVLFYMAKKFGISIYKYLAYGIALLAFFSLVDDWGHYFDISNTKEAILEWDPLMNRFFLTSIYAAIGYLGALSFNKNFATNTPGKIANVILVIVSIFVCYQVFANEILMFFESKYYLSESKHVGDYGYDWMDYDRSWKDYSIVWILMYTGFFFFALGHLNLMKFKNKVLGYSLCGLGLFVLLLQFIPGFLILANFRENAAFDYADAPITTWNYNFRYVYLPFVFLSIYMIYVYRNSELLSKVRTVNTWLFHICMLIVLSNELTHIMTMTHLGNYRHYEKVSYRMGYTVLWGLYSMVLITYGILRKRKMLRVIAISLFGLTIFKLAIDAMSMSRGYQLIVFITIGLILLVVSFMYQKFKPLLFGEEINQTKSGETFGEVKE